MLNLEANSPAGTQILVNPVRETGSKFELLYNQAHKVTINLSGRNNKRIIVAKRAVMGAWRFNVKMAVLVPDFDYPRLVDLIRNMVTDNLC